MFVKCIHYVGATVHDGIGLVLGVLTENWCSSIRFVALTASTSSPLWVGESKDSKSQTR